MIFAYISGWRRREITELTWAEVDLDGGVIRLDPRRSKNATGRALPISEALRAVLERRLVDMDRMGIDVQAISTGRPQFFYWTPPELGRETSRIINDNLADIVARHPDRFVAMGTVPLPTLGVGRRDGFYQRR